MAQREADMLIDKIERARIFSRWMWLGVVLGAILGVWKVKYPWAGEGVTVNLAFIAGNIITLGLVARGVCWIWLSRTKGR